ncbi:MAG: energy transducer TonB [Candidatus Obscuribacter sp.]|nr:energy transducer TonB [Candidatus Melainabacteria bacterium]MDX1989824.1 energy transducer TonB [Candidatus Obscuribacter sp.]
MKTCSIQLKGSAPRLILRSGLGALAAAVFLTGLGIDLDFALRTVFNLQGQGAASSGLPCQMALAETFKLGAQESESLEPAEPIFAPSPVITEEMLESGIKAFCVARFEISPLGKHVVHLVTSTGSAEVDELTLSTLRTWRFRPGKRGGQPAASVRKIKVEFEVD